MSNERIRRPQPSRTEPLRSWSTLFGVPGSGSGGDGRDGAAASLGDVVSRSVDLGYRVVDEYVRQGQKAAQRMSERSWEPEAMTRDVQDVMARMMRYGSDFFSVWMQFLELSTGSFGRGFDFGLLAPARTPPPPEPPRAPANGHATSGGAAPERTRVRIEVASVRPAEVSLDLRADAARLKLVVHSLRAVDPEKPRLPDVVLVPIAAEGALALRIRIPDDHPSGIYNGMIIDEDSNQPVGTVSVRVGART